MFDPNKPLVSKRRGFWYAQAPGHPPTGWAAFDTAIYWVGCYYTNPGASTRELNTLTNQYRKRLLGENGG